MFFAFFIRLEPLLQRIKDKPNTVTIPIIDNISEDTLEYFHDSDAWYFQVGGFTWSGHFTWINVQNGTRRKSAIDAAKSPTMAGGLFAIDRKYFWRVGSYDDKMDGWGGENLEMSFRVSLFCVCLKLIKRFDGLFFCLIRRYGNAEVHW